MVPLLCLASGAVAATITLLVTPSHVPSSLTDPDAPTSIPLIAEAVHDPRTVGIGITRGGEASLTATTGGRITRTACAPDGQLVSGGSTFTVDGAALLNLHTATPLWRPLTVETTGADVSALQAELIRLGMSVQRSGTFDHATWDGYRRIAERAGIRATPDRVSPEAILWLPAATVTATTCPAQLGHRVTADDPLATLSAPILSAAVKDWPTDLVPGKRTLTVSGIDVAVTRRGRIVDTRSLAELAATAAYRDHAAAADGGPLSAELRLIEPVTAYSAPPAAVAAADDTGCVRTPDGTVLPVRIVGSRLGRTHLAFEPPTTAPSHIATHVEPGLTCT